jgi:hypothetical protein
MLHDLESIEESLICLLRDVRRYRESEGSLVKQLQNGYYRETPT